MCQSSGQEIPSLTNIFQQDMKNGKFDEGEATLRLKLTLEEGKVLRS